MNMCGMNRYVCVSVSAAVKTIDIILMNDGMLKCQHYVNTSLKNFLVFVRITHLNDGILKCQLQHDVNYICQ